MFNVLMVWSSGDYVLQPSRARRLSSPDTGMYNTVFSDGMDADNDGAHNDGPGVGLRTESQAA